MPTGSSPLPWTTAQKPFAKAVARTNVDVLHGGPDSLHTQEARLSGRQRAVRHGLQADAVRRDVAL